MKKKEKVIEELMENSFETSFDKAVSTHADDIAKKIRKELSDKQMIEQSQEWMVKALIRHMTSKILRELKKMLKDELKNASLEIKTETKKFVKEQLVNDQQLQGPPKRPRQHASTSKSSKNDKKGKEESELRDEVQHYKERVVKLSNRLDGIFNTLLKVYPELQALPIIERTGSTKIIKLCRMMDKKKEDIMPFLEKLEKNGIVNIEGDTVRSLKPLFKRS